MIRIDGYYWVRIAAGPDAPASVMEWVESARVWYSCGDAEPWDDSEIYVLSGRLESPTRAT